MMRTTRTKPREMAWVLRVMLAGAATAFGAGLVGFTQRDELEVEYRQRIADGLPIDVAKVPSVVQTTIVGGVVLGCVLATIWIVLAVLLQRQSRPARWVATVLCVINVVAATLWVVSAAQFGTGGMPVASVVAQVVSFACALATLVLLWTVRVRYWFSPETPREAAAKLREEAITQRQARAARLAQQQKQRAAAAKARKGKS